MPLQHGSQPATLGENSIDIRELRYFLQIARAGSFSRAAAELYIAQPAMSRQITKLEQELGVELFVRHGRGIKLTTAGAMPLTRIAGPSSWASCLVRWMSAALLMS